jgi:hypothetical protein
MSNVRAIEQVFETGFWGKLLARALYRFEQAEGPAAGGNRR